MKVGITAAVLACAAVLATYGLSLEAVELGAFAIVLALISVEDVRHRRIPNRLLVVAVLVRAGYLALLFALGRADAVPATMRSLVGAFALGLLLLAAALVAERFLGEGSMGGGDVKLFAVSGLYFGFGPGLFVVGASCLLGAVYGVVSSAVKAPSGEGRADGAFPLGPFIALACIAVILLGSPAANLVHF